MTVTMVEAVTALINGGRPGDLFQLQEKWLLGEEVAQFHFLRTYVRDYGELPPFKVFNAKFKTSLPVAGGRWGYCIKELKDRFTYTTLAEALPESSKKLKKDPSGTLTHLKTVLSSLEGDVGHKDLEYAAEATKRKDRYEERVGKGGVTYISTGDPILDAQWYGYQKTDLITLAGKSGVGKSWLMCYLAILCDNTLPEEMGPLLFVTNEMTEDEIADRMDCIKFKLAYERFLSGELNRLEYRRYCKGLENLEASKNKMVILYNINTIDDLHQKMLLYRPAIVFLDGSYLMEPDKEEDWKKIVFITRHLKGLAKTTGTPIVNSTQLKRGAKNSRSKMSFDAQEDFAWGSSFVMDSDIAMRGYQDAKMQYLGEVGWEYAKGRRIKPGTELILQSDLETMEFQFKNKSEGKKFEEDDEEVVF